MLHHWHRVGIDMVVFRALVLVLVLVELMFNISALELVQLAS